MISTFMLSLLAFAPQPHSPRRAAAHLARFRPLRLEDDLGAVGDRALSALDAAITALEQEESSAAAKPYLTQEERDQVLADLQVQRRAGQPPPPPTPPPAEQIRGLTLNQDEPEARLSAPVSAASRAPSPPPGAAPSPERMQPYDQMLPVTLGSREEQAERQLRPPPTPYEGVRLLQLDALERANVLLLLFLLAGGFGTSSPQLWDDGLVFLLRLAASALLFGHALVAGYGVTLVFRGSSDGEHSQPAAAWAARLLLTGPAGLRSLRKERSGGA